MTSPRTTQRRSVHRRSGARGVRSRLERFGLLPVPPPAGNGVLGERLAAALADLGPEATALGRHLAWRADLLPWADRQPLAERIPASPPRSPEACAEALRFALGRRPEEVFGAWDPVPREVRFLEQRHGATAAGGGALELRLALPPTVEENGDEGADGLPPEDLLEVLLEMLLEVLAEDVPGPGLRRRRIATAPGTSFSETYRRSRDLRTQRRFLERRRGVGEATAQVCLTLPRPWTGFGASPSPAVLVLHSLDGVSLPPDAVGRTPYERSILALALWRCWLGEVWGGEDLWHRTAGDPATPLPVPAGPEDLRPLEGGGVAFLGSGWVEVDRGSRRRLRRYLAALARKDEEAAAGILLAEVGTAGAGAPVPADVPALERRLRQADAPLEADRSGTAGLAAVLLAHWHLLSAAGCSPGPAFDGFYRGTAVVAALAGALAPGAQRAAADGLREVRLREGVDGLAPDFGSADAGGTLLRHAELLAGLPEKLDQVLCRVETGDLRVRLSEEPARAGHGWSLAAAGALVLAGLGLVGRVAVEEGWPGAEPTSALALLIFGCWWLAAIRGGRGER